MTENIINNNSDNSNVSEHDFFDVLLLVCFIGNFGVHRFCTGHTLIGCIQLFTFGVLGLWTFFDFILICFGKYKDSKGLPLKNYKRSTGISVFVIAMVVFVLFVALLVFLIFYLANLMITNPELFNNYN